MAGQHKSSERLFVQHSYLSGQTPVHTAQIREEILVPDLYVLTVELVAYKKKD